MASLPAVIFQFAMSPYEDWHQLAWAGALLITATVLTLSIIARVFESERRTVSRHELDADGQHQREGSIFATCRSTTARTKALKNVSLPLYDRKVTAFIGPSGCGKSTLLRVLNRIYELYPNQRAEGEVVLDGENILSAKLDPICCARASAWCSRSRRRSR